jgi:uncharacterized OsmC-like protein
VSETITKTSRNGVDIASVLATVNVVKENPTLGAFQFRSANEWVSGTHSRSSIRGFYGAGAEDTTREHTFVFDADHPAVLVGTNQGPTPVEFLLHAIASCLTAGIANIAAARGVTLTEVRSTVTGDIDLRAILGLTDEVRNGYQKVAVRFTVKGDAPVEKLRQVVAQSVARSAVYDVLTNGVPVEVEVDAETSGH